MRTKKIIRTLKLLSHKEIKCFGQHVNSPLFNTSQKCIDLYELLLPYAPEFTSGKLDAPEFTKRIYTNKGSLDILYNKFINLLEEYIAILQLREKESYQKYLLLEGLRKRKAQNHFNLAYKRNLGKIKKEKRSIEKYYGEYLLERSNLEMLYDRVTDKDVLRKHLVRTIRAFDKYIVANHLLLDNTVLNSLLVGGTEETTNLIKDTRANAEEFIKIGNQEDYRNETLIKLHLLLEKLHRNKGEQDFLRLFNGLEENKQLVEKNDFSFFFIDMANFCMNKIMEGDSKYYDELFKVYLCRMDNETFLDGDYLTTNRMKNIIVIAAQSGEITLGHRLLEEYIDLIEPDYRNVVEAYCKGYLFFREGAYELAAEHLKKCIDLKSLFEWSAQTNLFQIYYENEASWAFETHIDAFVARLARHKKKNPKGNEGAYIKFCNILKKIYRIRKAPDSRKHTHKIRAKIEGRDEMFGKKWLLGKLEELDKNKRSYT